MRLIVFKFSKFTRNYIYVLEFDTALEAGPVQLRVREISGKEKPVLLTLRALQMV